MDEVANMGKNYNDPCNVLCFFFVIIGAVAGVVVQVTDPYGKIFEAQRRQCTAQCENASNATVCMTECLEKLRSPK